MSTLRPLGENWQDLQKINDQIPIFCTIWLPNTVPLDVLRQIGPMIHMNIICIAIGIAISITAGAKNRLLDAALADEQEVERMPRVQVLVQPHPAPKTVARPLAHALKGFEVGFR